MSAVQLHRQRPAAVGPTPHGPGGDVLHLLVPLRGRLVSGGIRTYERSIVPALAARDDVRLSLAVWKEDADTLEWARGLSGPPAVHPIRRPGFVADQWTIPDLAEWLGVDAVVNLLHAAPLRGRFLKALVIHGPDYYLMPETLDRFNRFKWFLADRLAVPAADLVVFVGETQRRDILRVRPLPLERTVVVSSGVDPRFRPMERVLAEARVRQRFGISPPFVLFVGHLFPIKNVSRVVRAFSALADRLPHRLVVAGGDRWASEADRALLKRLVARGRANQLGPVDHDVLPALYAAAECLVLPSLYESFSITLLEAMACGCPILTSDRGGNREVAGDAAVYVDPESVEDIAAGLFRLLADAALRRELAARGIERARTFTWERSAAALVDALRAIRARRKRHASA